MTESQVVNEGIGQGEAKGRLEACRSLLLKALTIRSPGVMTGEITRLINNQDNLAMLEHWFEAILLSWTSPQFLEVLNKRKQPCLGRWDWHMDALGLTESEVVNDWLRQGQVMGRLMAGRQSLLEVLTCRFPGAVGQELARQVNQQDNLPLLDDWFRAALQAHTFEQFLEVLNK